MSTKVLLRWFVISSLVVITLLLWVGATPVRADCGGPPSSSCNTCHAQADPVSGKGEWHSIHASKDICIKCHGGNGSTMDKNLAHEGLVANPLNDIYTDCHSCHPQDYVGRAELFATTLGVTPGSCATPTPIPVTNTSGEPPSGGINIPTNLVSFPSSPHPFFVIGAMLLILTLFLFVLGLLNSHREKF
jgi:hypothetical protein